ncbi:MAG: AbrB/MazE/SpoVT family DNA-binding domain-containing protein [Endozoicomonadaceae bacterium]|nr:AbrB/MazE/SpoVT family DNA-binding domain-containing protein [Endozoicomonadaceae bacterium]
MTLAKLTTKGQVTIPKDIRESLQLHSGDKIDFFVRESGEAVMRPISRKVDDVFCRLKNIKKKTVSVEEMNQAIKNRLKEKHYDSR